ncbi:uncharacterized protein [Watersipora subatra]|uniref:uncharacterized protein n=1 Tax=Watersipora subatra TaxID=2589382 RepID=UPI00355C464E
MKPQVLFIFTLIGLASATHLSPEEIAKRLDATPIENYIEYLKPKLQEELTKRAGPGAHVQHWCCKVKNGDPTPMLKTRKQVLYEKVSISVTTGYQGCGLWGSGRCAQTTARYHQEVKYGTRYLMNPNYPDCPSEHVICCAQYHLVNKNCIHTSTLIEHTDDFDTLVKLGLIKGDD